MADRDFIYYHIGFCFACSIAREFITAEVEMAARLSPAGVDTHVTPCYISLM